MNPRNATAGALKLQDSQEAARHPNNFYAYQIATDAANTATDADDTELLKSWGFQIEANHALCKNIDEILDYINIWEQKRHTLPYDIDGIVLKVNEIAFEILWALPQKHSLGDCFQISCGTSLYKDLKH